MKKKHWYVIAGVLAALIILTAVAYAVIAYSGAKQVDEAYAALAASGAPMDGAELLPQPVADADNAALLYAAVVLKLKSSGGDDAPSFEEYTELAAAVVKQTASPADHETLQQLFESPAYLDALANLRQAANKPGYWQNVNFSDGVNMTLPHLSDQHDLARIASASAILAAPQNPELAWQRLETAFLMATHGHDEPILISQLVRMAQFGMALDALERIAIIAPPTVDQANTIDALLRDEDERIMDSFALALHGERLFFGEHFFNLDSADVAEIGATADSNNLAATLIPYLPFLNFDRAAYLNLWLGYHELAQTPFRQSDLAYGEEAIHAMPAYCIFTRMLAPSLGSSKLKFVEARARLRMARIGLALQRHRADGTAYPDTLAPIGELASLQDPFAEAPFVYRHQANAPQLYSLGQNMTDDQAGPETDLIWQLTTKTK